MASLAGAVRLTAPTVPLFGVAWFIAVLGLLARVFGLDIPWVSDHVADTFLIAFLVLTAGVVFRGR